MNIGCVKKFDCCGCYSCYNSCPVSAIKMEKDNVEGVLYPVVDGDRCVECGRCVRRCPALNSRNPVKAMKKGNPYCFAAMAKDDSIRENSSSGGIFSLLSGKILDDGGIVFGAAFDSDYSVEHIKVTRKENLSKLRGAKYVQSRINFTYRDVNSELKSGRKVLFSGTPCQCEGVAAYLGRDYDNLYLIDFICHGIPSPMIWQKYLKFRSQGKLISSVYFRKKISSWELYSMEITFKDTSNYIQDWHHDVYMRGFIRNLYLRSSCYTCQYRKRRRISDITLADFWGIDDLLPDMNDNRGTSLLLVQSGKGMELLKDTECKMMRVDYEQAINHNPAYFKSPATHAKREEFFKRIATGENIEGLILDCTRDSLYKRMRQKLSDVKQRLIRMK